MTRLSAKTEIGVTSFTTRISASVSTIESPPATSGSAAATTPRKTQSASRKSSGNAISSARKRSCSDCDAHLLVRDGRAADLARQRRGQALRDRGMLARAGVERRGDEHEAPVGRDRRARLDDGDRRLAAKPAAATAACAGRATTRIDGPGTTPAELESSCSVRKLSDDGSWKSLSLELRCRAVQAPTNTAADRQHRGDREDRAGAAYGEIGEGPEHRPAA